MRLLEAYVREAVIDAGSRFKDKRKKDLTDKVLGIVNDMPGIFQAQEKQEAEINQSLNDLQNIPDRLVNQKRARIAVSGAFSDDEFGPQGHLFDVIAWSSPRDHHYESLRRFVQLNADAFESAAHQMELTLADVETYAESLKWSAPWRRYTQWASSVQKVQDFTSSLAKMLA